MTETRIPPHERLAAILARARKGGIPVVLLGMGNELRGDDAVGTLLARDLEEAALPGLKSFPVGIAIENSTHLVSRNNAGILFLVDAVALPEEALGAWDFQEPERLDAFIHSTHSVPLNLFVALWRSQMPGLEVHFIGINIGPTETFGEMCGPVAAARNGIGKAFREGMGG